MSRQPTPRATLGFTATRRGEILEILRAAGPNGLSRATLIFAKRCTQCGARVGEWERMGYVIDSALHAGEPETSKRLPIYKQADFFDGLRKTCLELFSAAVRE